MPVVMPRPELPERDPGCPFCPGNEDQTPPEILRDPPGPQWQVRVVPNMYAALSGEGPATRSGEPMFREMPGIGSHEVVIETPRHDGRMDEMSREEVAVVVGVWRERPRADRAARRRAVVGFQELRTLAGTSLTHPHSADRRDARVPAAAAPAARRGDALLRRARDLRLRRADRGRAASGCAHGRRGRRLRGVRALGGADAVRDVSRRPSTRARSATSPTRRSTTSPTS